MGLESGSGLAGPSWLRVSHEFAVKMQDLHSPEGLTGAGRLASKTATHMDAVLMLAVSRRPQFLTPRTSPWGCLSALTPWQRRDPGESKVEATMSVMT